MSLFNEINDKTVFKSLQSDIIKERIPINANIYLTNKCNFKCLHCYVQSQKNFDIGSLNIKQWKVIIDTLKEKGCLSITLSGGEVLASEKFIEIYRYISEKNIKITILTNLSLLNSKHIELFLKKKPENIIVTIYGSSNETYFKFCGVKNAWDIVKNNILLLKKNNLNIQLQTVLNTINYSELDEMKNFALENQILFNVFRNINCEIDGNPRPLQYQITLQNEIDSFEIMGDSEAYINFIKGNTVMWNSGYKKCFAGIANCYIDCCGNMFLCNHSSDEKFNIIDLGFDLAWNQVYKIRQKEIETINACYSCSNKFICGKCTPTFKKLEKSIGFPFPDCEKIEVIKKYFNMEEEV